MPSRTDHLNSAEPNDDLIKRLYPFVDESKSCLPRCWSYKDKFQFLGLSQDNRRIHYKGKESGYGKSHKDAAAVRATHPIPAICGLYYYEVKIVSKGRDGYMGIGFSQASVSLNRLPGWDKNSYGYHGDDGCSFCSCGSGQPYGPTFTTNDVVGCGLNLVERTCFYTKNGQHLGTAFTNLPPDLYPTVGLQTHGEVVDTNFGQEPFLYNIENEIREVQARIRRSVDIFPLAPSYCDEMSKLVLGYLTHHGYTDTVKSFSQASGFKLQEDLVSVANRQKIQKLILAGHIGEAIEAMSQKYPGLFEKQPDLLFMLKCRQFIEMVNGTDPEVTRGRPFDSKRSTAGSPSPSVRSQRSPLVAAGSAAHLPSYLKARHSPFHSPSDSPRQSPRRIKSPRSHHGSLSPVPPGYGSGTPPRSNPAPVGGVIVPNHHYSLSASTSSLIPYEMQQSNIRNGAPTDSYAASSTPGSLRDQHLRTSPLRSISPTTANSAKMSPIPPSTMMDLGGGGDGGGGPTGQEAMDCSGSGAATSNNSPSLAPGSSTPLPPQSSLSVTNGFASGGGESSSLQAERQRSSPSPPHQFLENGSGDSSFIKNGSIPPVLETGEGLGLVVEGGDSFAGYGMREQRRRSSMSPPLIGYAGGFSEMKETVIGEDEENDEKNGEMSHTQDCGKDDSIPGCEGGYHKYGGGAGHSPLVKNGSGMANGVVGASHQAGKMSVGLYDEEMMDNDIIDNNDEIRELVPAVTSGVPPPPGWSQADVHYYQRVLDFGRDLLTLSQQLAQKHGPNPRNRQMLENAYALLAYPNPLDSPVSFQLNLSQREPLALTINSAILKSQGYQAEPSLERTLRHSVTLQGLMEDNGMGTCAFIQPDTFLGLAQPPLGSQNRSGGPELSLIQGGSPLRSGGFPSGIAGGDCRGYLASLLAAQKDRGGVGRRSPSTQSPSRDISDNSSASTPGTTVTAAVS